MGGSELRERLSLSEQRILALKRDVEGVLAPRASTAEQAGPGPLAAFSGSVDSLTYVGFEDRFRGSHDDIRARVEDYLPILASATDVIDVGCGRGEMLELLRQRGVAARGADVNRAMVELCRSRGLDVEEADGLSYLERQGDGGVGGLVAIQVVEHFAPGYLTRFLETAYHKMRPGAPLILETINPACWMAFFECYIRDLTHQRPLHPDTLQYLVQASGFAKVNVQFRQQVRDADRLERVPALATDSVAAGHADLTNLRAAVNAHADKLNSRLFSSMDYVVIARR
jgi:O-antigen chain-terminating methyltransferase